MSTIISIADMLLKEIIGLTTDFIKSKSEMILILKLKLLDGDLKKEELNKISRLTLSDLDFSILLELFLTLGEISDQLLEQ